MRKAHLTPAIAMNVSLSVAGRLVARKGSVDRYRQGVVVLMLVSIGVLALTWSIGDDPATLALQEPAGLREELADLRKASPEELMLLNEGSPHRWILGPGFAAPEADGAWVNATSAQLVFYLPSASGKAPDRLELELSMSPLLTEGQTSRLVLIRSAVDEVAVALPPGGARVFLALPPGEEQVVELTCDNLDAPPEVESSADVRRLCVKLYAMAIRTSSGGDDRT